MICDIQTVALLVRLRYQIQLLLRRIGRKSLMVRHDTCMVVSHSISYNMLLH